MFFRAADWTSSLTTPIMETFGINEVQMGAVSTVALVVAAVLYPIWGYLYDRYARAKLLALASFIWGATTWLNGIVRTFPAFLTTRASTGIDDSSYPGLFSLVGDYFGPKVRGRVYGILQLTQPIGYLVGMLMALMLAGMIGWRSVFYITGSLGILLAVLIVLASDQSLRASVPAVTVRRSGDMVLAALLFLAAVAEQLVDFDKKRDCNVTLGERAHEPV